MAQIFSERFGLSVQLVVLVMVIVMGLLVVAWRRVTGPPHGLNEAVLQPVPFSHQHHVGDLAIDCRMCHSMVEQEAVAGMPPVSTCMGCHSQLYTNQKVLVPVVASWESGVPLHWHRVYDLPDFVYFNHSIHIAKGVGCESCHGRIDRMPLVARAQSLSMQWCLDCHRDPERNLRPRDKVFSMGWEAPDQRGLGRKLVREYHIDKRRLTECSLCHR